MWRNFLDALSFFGDYDFGGRTVTAVAVDGEVTGLRYLVAARQQRSQEHIQHVLEMLSSVSADHKDETVKQLMVQSMDWSHMKIKNYKRQLTLSLAQARDSAASASDVMLAALDDMLKLKGSKLCKAAELFEIRELQALVCKTISAKTPSPWSKVHHYVGRLRSWRHKTALVVNFATHFPAYISPVECTWLGLPSSTKMPAFDDRMSIESTVQRTRRGQMISTISRASEVMPVLRTMNIQEDFRQAYQASQAGYKLTIHAEVFLMEHFYFNNLTFAEGYRYIGASKQSCYCCDLYMKYHPIHCISRPSHGTAWGTWSIPLIHEVHEEEKRIHTISLMKTVIRHMRDEIEMHLTKQFPKRARHADSSSCRSTMSY